MNTMTSEQPVNHAETLELINTEITASLTQQYDSVTKIDTKAVILIGYAGAASSFLATRHGQPVLATLAYVAYGISVGFGIWTFGLRIYRHVPAPRWLLNDYWTSPKAEVLAALAATRTHAYESNARVHRQKTGLWWISLLSLTVGVTMMLFSLTSAYW